VFFLRTFFYYEVAARLPGAQWSFRSPSAAVLEDSWPAHLAVFPAAAGLAAGDVIELCVTTEFPLNARVGVSTGSALHAATLRDIRLSALTEGTLAAMTLAALGMSLVLQRFTFLLFAGGLAMACVYVLVSNGSLLSLPGGPWLMRELPLQRIAGISASLMMGEGLARFIELKKRHLRLWRIFVSLQCGLGFLLLCSIAPTPLRFFGLGVYSNAIMVLMILLLFLSAILGAAGRHRPSIALLTAWGPAMLLVVWMGVAVSLEEELAAVARWLFPLALVYACSSLFTELARRIAATQAERDLARLRARTDKLTGAMTRDELESQLSALHAVAITGDRSYSLLFVDFDHFKRVNDEHGHAVGDAVLSAATERIQALLRSRDSVGRYGGEEFVVLLEGLRSDAAREVAERIRAEIENGGRPIAEGVPALTVSIGVACHRRGNTETVEQLLEQADAALYQAKAAGRNRVVLAS